MTTYNTGNPIGSTAAKDLYDNAENLDVAVNSTAPTWVDRLGNVRPTLHAATGTTAADLEVRLASTGSTDGASLIGRGAQVVSSIAELRDLLKTTPSRHAFVTGYYAEGDGGGGAYYLDEGDTTSPDNGGTVIVADDGARWKLVHNGMVSVKQFGAKGDGITNDAAAIDAADAAACAGNVGLDGVTVVAEMSVYFPPGTYRINSELTYRGAPWVGAGIATTFLMYHGSSGACINAVGSNSARKLLSISDMSLDGSNATGDVAHGLRLGYNQRSFGALRRVRIDHFPGPAIYLAAPAWSMTFFDTYCSFNANGSGSVGTAIYQDPALVEGTLLAFHWFNLQLENNGYAGSSVGGGIDLTSNAVYNWKFFGGVWEGNLGKAEGRFVGVNQVHIDGTYLESEAASVEHGLVFTDTYGSVRDVHLAGESGMTGNGLHITGTSQVDVGQVLSNINWVNDLYVGDTSLVRLGSTSGLLLFTVEDGASLCRGFHNRQQLTDAASIAVDAAQANSFYVTLFDHRTIAAPSNPSIGQQITFTIIQNGISGACNVTWNSVFKHSWSDTGNSAGKRSTIRFEYDGTTWNQIGAQSPYM